MGSLAAEQTKEADKRGNHKYLINVRQVLPITYHHRHANRSHELLKNISFLFKPVHMKSNEGRQKDRVGIGVCVGWWWGSLDRIWGSHSLLV